MLSAAQRLRRREQFAAAVRAGRRAGRGGVVVHLTPGNGAVPQEVSQTEPARAEATATVRAGFVVPKSVGNAVIRNKVRRRLRHLARERLASLPPGTDLVVRAVPEAAGRAYAQLGADLDAALAAAQRPRARRRSGT